VAFPVTVNDYSARQHILYIYVVRAICYRPYVYPSVCPSHEWISQKRLKLGLCSVYYIYRLYMHILFHPSSFAG